MFDERLWCLDFYKGCTVFKCIFSNLIFYAVTLFPSSPLPKDSVPREPPPMRDEMVFKSATRIRRIPNSLVPVPHT